MPELLRRAVARDIVAADLRIDRTTAWRACRRLGLPTRARPSKREGDMRRWRYPHRMQCVLADGKHFRAGAKRLRRVALFFIDDATRYGLDVLVGTSESTEMFLRGLYQLVLRHGLTDLFYLDRGPGFISGDTLAVVQGGLGAWLIHGAARYPQGRGAVERFNRTASEQVLRSLDGAIEVDPACAALTLRLRHFLRLYNDPRTRLWAVTPRGSTGSGDAPCASPKITTICIAASWCAPCKRYRPTTSSKPTGGSGKRRAAPPASRSRWHATCSTTACGSCTDGRMVELAVLDPHANATDPRGRPHTPPPLPGEGVPDTAASIRFAHDLRPLVDADGGFRDPQPPDDPPDQEHH